MRTGTWIPAQHTLTAAALNQLIEPNDICANALLELMTPQELLALIGRADHVPGGLSTRVEQVLGQSLNSGSAQDPAVALTRWRKRLPYANAQAALDTIKRLGGGLLTPEDPQWPAQLNDLGYGKPLCLWWRAAHPERLAAQRLETNVSIVGSRDSSDYGNQVTHELARTLGHQGFSVVSGGAYGIDAVAHRAALSHESWGYAQPPTITILAGGADRLYPAGNERLLQQVIADGVLLSEVPPGSTPTRFRFLNRNRLIAAISRLSLVTEARHRSGALNTASHAVELGREVAAVPGSVFSPNSAGTHRLLRTGAAALVASPQDVLELLGCKAQCAESADPRSRPTDRLSSEQSLVFDVLSYTQGMIVDEVCARCGLPISATLRALGALESVGLAATDGMTWKLVRPAR